MPLRPQERRGFVHACMTGEQALSAVFRFTRGGTGRFVSGRRRRPLHGGPVGPGRGLLHRRPCGMRLLRPGGGALQGRLRRRRTMRRRRRRRPVPVVVMRGRGNASGKEQTAQHYGQYFHGSLLKHAEKTVCCRPATAPVPKRDKGALSQSENGRDADSAGIRASCLPENRVAGLFIPTAQRGPGPPGLGRGASCLPGGSAGRCAAGLPGPGAGRCTAGFGGRPAGRTAAGPGRGAGGLTTGFGRGAGGLTAGFGRGGGGGGRCTTWGGGAWYTCPGGGGGE